jgi:multiple sugar transport system ATP-binding protein
MVSVLLDAVSMTYPDGPVINGLTLRVEQGELVVLLGPSGSGKTLVLRLVAGLERPSSGDVLFDGEPIGELPTWRRNVAMVFQDNVLYPRFDARRNIAFPLEIQELPESEVADRVEAESRVLAIERILERMPSQLSAGEQQLVQAAKAFVRVPDLFLMDEPLGRLDPATRKLLRTELRLLQQAYGVTTIYATHDQDDALVLADRVVVMDQGRIRQVGAPLDVYRRPADIFVAEFVGSPSMSMLRGTTTVDGIELGEVTLTGRATKSPREVVVGVRPDGWEQSDAGLSSHVERVEDLGSHVIIDVDSAAGNALVRLKGVRPRVGDELRLSPTSYHLFDARSGRAIFHLDD